MRKEFDVYFNDGNHRILEASSILAVMVFLVEEGTMDEVREIKRRKEN